MKISSTSILSPGRTGYSREPPPISLSTSLSRKLSNSRSIKRAASPAIFPKKRGCGFDNPEPSSPKVTCIGQVRVKSRKKHGAKNLRTLSRRRRKLDHSRSQNQQLRCSNNSNQRWVHIPLTICEGLRAFGSEVSCLFPCRSSCSSMEKEEKMEVGNLRRHVFDNLEIVNDIILGGKDEPRVSICVPPKNALLLMRCRSDPLKMEALTNRFWEPDFNSNEEIEEDEESVHLEMEDGNFMVLDGYSQKCESFQDALEINSEMEMESVQEQKLEMVGKQSIEEDDDEEHSMEKQSIQEEVFQLEDEEHNDRKHGNLQKCESFQDAFESNSAMEVESFQEQKSEMVEKQSVQEEDDHEQGTEKQSTQEEVFQLEDEDIDDGNHGFLQKCESFQNVIESNSEMEAEKHTDDQEQAMKTSEEEEEESFFLGSLFEENEVQNQEIKEQQLEDEDSDMEDAQEELFEDEDAVKTETEESNEEILAKFIERSETPEETHEEIEVRNEENDARKKIIELPECLLLMMYEPKLSMEISKETWVCRSDFIRRHSGGKKPPPPPPPPVESTGDEDEPKVIYQQPGRSSCSFPAPNSMMSISEQKVVKTIGFEPLVLTRCNSEPMRKAQETCYWQKRLEPPRRASFGVGNWA